MNVSDVSEDGRWTRSRSREWMVERSSGGGLEEVGRKENHLRWFVVAGGCEEREVGRAEASENGDVGIGARGRLVPAADEEEDDGTGSRSEGLYGGGTSAEGTSV